MGLFCLPSKPSEEMTAADYVECAVENLTLWRDHPDATYLLKMASGLLQRAAEQAEVKP